MQVGFVHIEVESLEVQAMNSLGDIAKNRESRGKTKLINKEGLNEKADNFSFY